MGNLSQAWLFPGIRCNAGNASLWLVRQAVLFGGVAVNCLSLTWVHRVALSSTDVPQGRGVN